MAASKPTSGQHPPASSTVIQQVIAKLESYTERGFVDISWSQPKIRRSMWKNFLVDRRKGLAVCVHCCTQFNLDSAASTSLDLKNEQERKMGRWNLAKMGRGMKKHISQGECTALNQQTTPIITPKFRNPERTTSLIGPASVQSQAPKPNKIFVIKDGKISEPKVVPVKGQAPSNVGHAPVYSSTPIIIRKIKNPDGTTTLMRAPASAPVQSVAPQNSEAFVTRHEKVAGTKFMPKTISARPVSSTTARKIGKRTGRPQSSSFKHHGPGKVFVTKAGKIVGGQFVQTIGSAPSISKVVQQQPTPAAQYQPTLTPTVIDQQTLSGLNKTNPRSLSPTVPNKMGTAHSFEIKKETTFLEEIKQEPKLLDDIKHEPTFLEEIKEEPAILEEMEIKHEPL